MADLPQVRFGSPLRRCFCFADGQPAVARPRKILTRFSRLGYDTVVENDSQFQSRPAQRELIVMPATEIVLSTLPSSHAGERVVVVLCQAANQPTRVELRQQSWGEGVGWFTQSTVPLDPDQVAQLRATLGSQVPSRPTRRAAVTSRGFEPRVVRAESA